MVISKGRKKGGRSSSEHKMALDRLIAPILRLDLRPPSSTRCFGGGRLPRRVAKRHTEWLLMDHSARPAAQAGRRDIQTEDRHCLPGQGAGFRMSSHKHRPGSDRLAFGALSKPPTYCRNAQKVRASFSSDWIELLWMWCRAAGRLRRDVA